MPSKLAAIVHISDDVSVNISLGNGRQTFRWLAHAVQARLLNMKVLRGGYEKEHRCITSFKNVSGELINPFDMIMEHVAVHSETVDLWAQCDTQIEIDKNGDPIYPEWLAAAVVLSEEGRRWQSDIAMSREREKLSADPTASLLPGSTLVQVGGISHSKGGVASAFSIDYPHINLAGMAVNKNVLNDILLDKIKSNYSHICNIFIHFCGPGQLGKPYGMSKAEFGRVLHYMGLANYKESAVEIDEIYLKSLSSKIIPGVAPLMSRAEMVRGLFLQLDALTSGQGREDDKDGMFQVLVERELIGNMEKTWEKISSMYVTCTDDVDMQRIVLDNKQAMLSTYKLWGDVENGVTLQSLIDLIDNATIQAIPSEKQCVAAFIDAQLDPHPDKELSTLVFREFTEAVARFAVEVIDTEGLTKSDKVRLAFNSIAEAQNSANSYRK